MKATAHVDAKDIWLNPKPIVARPSRSCCLSRKDFTGIFTTMKGLPVTVRLLDPPLHEFFPHDVGHEGSCQEMGVTPAKLKVEWTRSTK